MRWIKIENGIGIRHGFGTFAPFGDEAFLGGVCPQVPLHLRRGGHLGLFKVWPLRGPLSAGPIVCGAAWRAIVSGAAWRAIVSGGRLACHCLRGPLGA